MYRESAAFSPCYRRQVPWETPSRPRWPVRLLSSSPPLWFFVARVVRREQSPTYRMLTLDDIRHLAADSGLGDN